MQDSELYLLLGRLEGKLDASLSGLTRLEQRQDTAEKRISELETAKAKGLGVWTAIAFAFTGLGTLGGALGDHIIKWILR